jgi:hypothetical protein
LLQNPINAALLSLGVLKYRQRSSALPQFILKQINDFLVRAKHLLNKY